jgi:hypothetical protein
MTTTTTTAPLVTDSVTMLGADTRGRAVIAASHAGIYAAYLAAKAGVKAVILSDAGVGRERAGIGGLTLLADLGVPGAAIGHRSARIGDGVDCAKRGVISHINAPAAGIGLRVGMHAGVALDLLAASELPPSPAPPPQHETRHRLTDAEAPGVRVVAVDSASLVEADDAGGIVLTGSHGALLGGRPETAMRIAAFAAIYNDADRGIDDCGVSRLPALDQRGIAGATVSAWSARIGDGLSTYRDGFVSAVNNAAARCGGEIGISAGELVARLVAAVGKEFVP